MEQLVPLQVLQLFSPHSTVNDRLAALHDRILQQMPWVSRIACALYDKPADLLKTFIHSTRQGQALSGYQAKLSEIPSLQLLAQQGCCRVIDDVVADIHAGTGHSDWLLAQNYQSSFTVPMYDQNQLLGFMFFDAMEVGAFTPSAQRDLLLFCNLINMALSSELAAVRAVMASAQVARDFVSLRDFETGAHLERMARYARLIAQGVAEHYQLNDETIEHIYMFAPLHDIGKIGIPDQVLLKPGPLTAEERDLMKTHVEKGVLIVNKVLGDFGLENLPDSQLMQQIVACHHEFLDGSGYPLGLSGSEVPIAARIVTVADIFDALSSQRPYKPTWSVPQALAELQKMVEQGKLDPLCVAALAKEVAATSWIRDTFVDAAAL